MDMHHHKALKKKSLVLLDFTRIDNMSSFFILSKPDHEQCVTSFLLEHTDVKMKQRRLQKTLSANNKINQSCITSNKASPHILYKTH
jgi:hypothetical protein